jgi:multidrug efflux pump subunit AcrA (membrane-fusion protein)
MPIAVLALVTACVLQSQSTAKRLQAGQKGAPRTLELPGQVEAVEQTKLHAKMAGFIEKVHVDIGDHVKKGQVLAELSVPEVEAELRQKEALIAQAEAEVELARRALQFAAASLALTTARVQEAESASKRAQAHYEHSKTEYARLEKMWQNKVIDKQVLDEKLHELEVAKAGLADVEAKVKAANAAQEESSARREMVQAEEKVALARREVARADAQRVETILHYAKVRAPFDGLVARRAVQTGDFPGRGAGSKAEPLFVVVRTDSVRIAIDVPEANVPFVKTGMRALVRFPAAKGKEFQATVSRIAGALDPGTRTLRAEIDLPNPEGKLLPGMFAVVAIPGAGPDDKPEKEAGPEEARDLGDLKALFQARLDAARRAYEEAVKSTQQTRRVADLIIPLARPQDVATWSLRWLNAQREMSGKKEDQIAALEAHLNRMKELQKRVTEMNKNGLASSLEVSAVEFHRREAELWLAREKAKFGPRE